MQINVTMDSVTFPLQTVGLRSRKVSLDSYLPQVESDLLVVCFARQWYTKDIMSTCNSASILPTALQSCLLLFLIQSAALLYLVYCSISILFTVTMPC